MTGPTKRFMLACQGIALHVLAALACLALAVPASAQVSVSFHSFNGSVLFGRFPHTFVVFSGTLDETGEEVDENFGFSARRTSAAITGGPAEHIVMTEEERQIRRTNRHFTIAITDEKYREMRAEVERWRDHPGKFYDLDENNCIHFVARMAEMVGLTSDVPEDYLRKPKAWLNYVTRQNPQLGVAEID